MAPYDSDSSGEGNEDFTETSVLLGYASKEPTADTVSQLGGYATWLDDSTPPSGALAKCKVCNDLTTLLLQLNGDLPEHFPGHERRLYIFGCRRRTCRRKNGCVRGIRATRIVKGQGKEKKESKPPAASVKQPALEEAKKPNIGDALFGTKSSSAGASNENPFATKSSPPLKSFASISGSANPFSSASSLAAKPAQDPDTDAFTLPETFASKARISSPPPESTTTSPYSHPDPWPSQFSFPLAYPTYHLDADYETLDLPNAPAIPTNARIDVDGEPGGGGSSKEDKELFESTLDKTFQRFADRVAQNPEQVIRYEFRGSPLLYSRTDAVGKALAPYQAGEGKGDAKVQTVGHKGGSGMPRCGSCGAERVFEVQLMPQAIAELEAEETGLEGMEWGTVILGVCARDCVPKGTAEGEVGYLDEYVGVQWEELISKKG